VPFRLLRRENFLLLVSLAWPSLLSSVISASVLSFDDFLLSRLPDNGSPVLFFGTTVGVAGPFANSLKFPPPFDIHQCGAAVVIEFVVHRFRVGGGMLSHCVGFVEPAVTSTAGDEGLRVCLKPPSNLP